jgi:hypothetical protein
MANFPELEPSTRSYNFGKFPTSTAASFAAGGVRFLHGDDSFGHEMTLEFLDISEDDAALIREHYRDYDGGHRSFILFSITWRGHPDVNVLVPFQARWKYVGPPQEDHLQGKLYNVTVSLQYVGASITS